MRQLIVFPSTEDYWLIQDVESRKFFRWRQANEGRAEEARANLQESWETKAGERERDLVANFVDRIEMTMVHRGRHHDRANRERERC